jgi:2-hydroxy-3-keto-5-methylthiopentenyl-1-phosphate phosphatase
VTQAEMLTKVKENLKIDTEDKDIIISDTIQEFINYCNISDIPEALEPFIRKKVQTIINYEKENGTETVFDVKSIKEGDTSITYNTEQVSRETIYGLSDNDKARLRRFRRLRK